MLKLTTPVFQSSARAGGGQKFRTHRIQRLDETGQTQVKLDQNREQGPTDPPVFVTDFLKHAQLGLRPVNLILTGACGNSG
jgi:hypothetical protein